MENIEKRWEQLESRPRPARLRAVFVWLAGMVLAAGSIAKTAKLYSIGLVAIMVFTLSQQTFAQLVDFYSSPGYTNMISNLIDNHIWNSSMERYTKNSTKQKNQGGSNVSKSKSSSQTSPPVVPEYRRYPAVQFKPTGTRLMVQEMADKFGKTPQEKADWKEVISGVLDKYEASARAQGYPNDLGLAYVSFIGLSQLMYNEITEKPIIPFEQNIALRDIVAKYATDFGIFSKITDREKQQLYEIFVIYGAVHYFLYELAVEEKDNQALKAYKLRAADNLKLARIKP